VNPVAEILRLCAPQTFEMAVASFPREKAVLFANEILQWRNKVEGFHSD